jgi:hypothetical protein
MQWQQWLELQPLKHQAWLVSEQGWLNEAQFTQSMALAQAAPGPNVLFVALMGATFLVSMFVVLPPPAVLKQALTVSVPNQPGALLMIAAFVGTTMAAPTFVTRPLLLKEKGLTSANLRKMWMETNLHTHSLI